MTTDIILTPEQATALERFRQSNDLAVPAELNTLRLVDVSNALSDGYRVESPKQAPILKPTGILAQKADGVPLTGTQLTAIERWFSRNSPDKVFFLRKHQDYLSHGGWTSAENKPLNDLSVDLLGQVLYYGYRPV